jgi:hypothetical protein
LTPLDNPARDARLVAAALQKIVIKPERAEVAAEDWESVKEGKE